MQHKLFLLILLFVISNHFVFGKNVNKTKLAKIHQKHSNSHKDNKTRLKRSLSDEINKEFKPSNFQYDHNLEGRGRIKLKPIVESEPPFWGTRGRRESGSDETVPDVQLPTYTHHKNGGKIKSLHKLLLNLDEKQRRQEADSPFWGNRGRRTSDESDENDIDIFWGNRGRRTSDESDEEDIDIFWGNRGRRQDEEPFWGTRGRREEDSPFWGNRGRRDDDEPFWGNRGRRQEPEPFWGNRGRRKIFEPNSLDRGKEKCRKNTEVIQPLWGNRAKLKEIKHSIIEAIENIQDNIDSFAVDKRDEKLTPFWINRGRDSKLKYLFNGSIRNRVQYTPASRRAKNDETKPLEPGTVYDDRIYAEEPRYILVERSSRSSAEDDPFFITRGKKYSEYDLAKAVRGRRGAIEEIFKSVRNDPYYIARGKKDTNDIKVGNSSSTQEQFIKTKELVCSTVDLLISKVEGRKVKRDNSDSERERRTMLNKLARQLQMDPYIVSRGKKNVETNEKTDSLEQFISSVIRLCN